MLGSAPVADRLRRAPMSDEELDRRTLAACRRVDIEADADPRMTKLTAQHLANVGKYLRNALRRRVSLRSVFGVVRVLLAVIARSYGPTGFAR